MRLIDLTRINQLIDDLLDKINDKYATKAELNSGLKGKAEVNHGMHLTLGNTQDSAFRGDYGNTAYQHSQTAHAPSNAQKNSDITKAEIEAKLTGIITSHSHSDNAPAEHGPHLELGTGSENAYYGDKGKIAYDHSQTAHAPSNAQKNSDITKAEIEAKLTGNISSHKHEIYALSEHGIHVPKSNEEDQGKFLSSDNTWKFPPVSVIPESSTNAPGIVQLNNNINSTDTTQAATANAVRIAHEKGTEALDQANEALDQANAALNKANEAFQSANNGKRLIANAIGDSGLTSNSTFSAMSNAITDKRDRLYNLMAEGGYEVSSDMSIGRLLEILESIGIGVSDIKQIACGGYHTVILKKDGSLYSCGNNGGGQLGIGTVTDNPTFTQVTTNISNDVKEVACGSTYTFILKNDGSIWACGEGGYGHLGLGSGSNKTTFTKVTTNVKQIACGSGHTFILKNDGSVWACGDNYYGQLGLGSTDNKYTFTRVTTNINNDVKQIACGDDFTFILKNDGSIWACGDGGDGQLGLGTNMYKTTFTKITTNINNDVKDIVCGDYHTVILKNDGSVWATGGNGEGQLGLGSTTGDNRSTFTKITTNVSNVKQIACGSIHTFILKNDNSLWACGDGSKGQLGLGISDKKTFTQVTTNISNDVKEIICGYEHTFILKNDGTVWSCGRNTNGQLGLGTIGSSNYGNFTNIPRGF